MKQPTYSREQRKREAEKQNVRKQVPLKKLGDRLEYYTEVTHCPSCNGVVMLADNVCIHCSAEYPVILSSGATPEGKA